MTVLPKGQYIKHYRYGFGVVIESNSEDTSIEFETGDTRKFVTNLMVVELSDFTPPEGFRSKWVKTAPASSAFRKSGAGKAASRPGTITTKSGRR
jgi:hypothetical protein